MNVVDEDYLRELDALFASSLRMARNTAFDLAITICEDLAKLNRANDAESCAIAIREAQQKLDKKIARISARPANTVQ